MEKRSTPKDVARPAVPSTTERSLREFSSPQRAFFLRCRPKLPVKAEKTPRFLKKTPRYLEHIPKVRTFASQLRLRTRALSSAGSERLPYKQRVGGSNPSAPTFFLTAIHRKMDSCFFCARRKRREGGRHTQVGRSAVRKTGIDWSCRRLFCVGMSDGCSFSCERVCAVAVGVWCHLLEKPIDGWRCSLKKTERKREKTGEVEHFFPAFYPTFRTIAYSSL